MASEERLRELEEKYEGFTVYDNQGSKIGKVDDLFVDESDQEEYIGVKMGFLGMKSTLIPTEIVRVNENDRTIEVSESKDRVKDAPSFDDDEDVTSEYEERIRRHFGLESLETSSGRGSYGGNPDDTTSPATATGGAAAGSGHEREDRSSSYETASGDQPDTHENHDTTDSGRSSSEAPDYDAQNATRTETAATASSGGGDTAAYEQQGTSTDRGAHQDESATGPARGTSEGAESPGGTYEDDRAGAGASSGRQEPGVSSGEEGSASKPPTTSRQTEETETFQEGGRTKVRRRIIREEVVDADDEGS